MKNLLLISVLAMVFSSCVTSKKMFSIAKTNTVSKDTIDVENYLEKYNDDDAVYLNREIIVEHWGSKGPYTKNWKYQSIRKGKYILLNPESEKYSVFKLQDFPAGAVSDVYLRVNYPDGTIKEYRKNDIKINKSNDYESWSFAYPALEKGTIIEEQYRMNYSFPSFRIPINDEFALESVVPIEKLKFTFAYPNWWKIKFKDLGPDRKLPIEYSYDEDNKKTIVTYTASNIPAFKNEPFMPYWKETGTYIQWLVTKFEMMNYSQKQYHNWEDIAADFKQYAVDNDSWFSGRVKNTTMDLIENIDDPESKLDTIISYIQNNIKVEGSAKVSDFPDVLKYKKGDAYIITGLVKLMLEKAGIESDYLMIHSAKEGYFDQDFYTLKQVSNPALNVNLEEQELLIFPYAKFLDYNVIPPNFLNQPALFVPKTNKESTRIIQTPAESPAKNQIKTKIDITIDEYGTINVNQTQSFIGISAFLLRNALDEKQEEEINDFIEEMLSYEQGEIEIEEIEIQNQFKLKKPLKFSIQYKLDNLISLTPEEAIFQTAGLFSPVNIQKRKFDPEKRTHPIKVSYAETDEKFITISFPSTWQLQSDLQNLDYSNKYGIAKSNFENQESNLTIHLFRKSNIAQGDKSEISKLMEIFSEQSKIYVPDIIFDINIE